MYLAREATPTGGFFAFVFFYYLLNFCFIIFHFPYYPFLFDRIK
ncbi:hypothetical protein XBO1_680001 [Xenorhabdus bovienii str. oregonense]|uniref:Uncharacterized protein n=1 Tax=Xenorhabdus bovienii str. oregonense TaxID=1398202 RepID=A0A077PDS8_XENBV|nr:hypothetical protein XBO1_680001 [Xenorhabdus bovienii str. oregonense]